MSIEVRVPTTGNAGEDAVLAELKASAGDAVTAGQVLAVLETAKAALEVESPADGVVLGVRCAVGDEVAEHSVLLIIGKPGETLPTGGVEATRLKENHGTVDAGNALAPDPTSHSSPVSPPAPGQAVSPRARLLAERRGIDLASIRGSGPGGRIIVPDVLSSGISSPSGGQAEGLMGDASAPHLGHHTLVPVRGARKVTAQRMAQSLKDSAQVTLTRYASADALVSFHERLRKYLDSQEQSRISLSDLVNFAVAQSLPRYPAANSIFDWDGIRQYSGVNLGVAVDTGSALLVPVVTQAHLRSLTELSSATQRLVEKARAGTLQMDEMEGGTFTVTNLGMFGIHWFTPVLNTPQSCILGVGALHRPSAGAPALLPLSFTFDHRALDGADAARALAGIAEALESIDVIAAQYPATSGQDLRK